VSQWGPNVKVGSAISQVLAQMLPVEAFNAMRERVISKAHRATQTRTTNVPI